VNTNASVRAPRAKGLSASPRQMLLLAPSASAARGFFSEVRISPNRFEDLMAEMQTLRGRIYLEEGAIAPDQLTNGRHLVGLDDGSWHLLVLDKDDRVCGCARYREYSNQVSFSDLAVSRSALADSPAWGEQLKTVIEGEVALARRLNVPYVELGGWALTEEIRATAEALRMALASYGLARGLGGGVGLSTVTRRNCSSTILRRMGGRSLEHRGAELPAYYDPQFRCEMEVLRFYSWAPNPRYNLWIDGVTAELSAIPVLANRVSGPHWQAAMRTKYSTATLAKQ
jgi:hypothetical protein